MYGVLVSAVNYLLAFVLRIGPIKFVAMAVVFTLVELLMQVVFDFLPDWMNLNGIFDFMTPEMWFFLDLVEISFGAPLIVGAWTTRFIIRRIPFVG